MSVNLQKGQKVDLTKGNAGLRRVMIGLGWGEAPQPSGGFLSGLFGSKKPKEEIDCDAIAFLLDANGRLRNKTDAIFFGNLEHYSKCVKHMGDNLTGGGGGDDEQMFIDLSNLPSQYEKIVVLVSIYKANQKNQHFGMIQDAFIRLVDADTNKELFIYNLSEKYPGMVAMVFGEIYRHNGEWKFGAIGEGLQASFVADLGAKYGLDPSVWNQ
jgi:stress response protein SCP2